MKLQPPRRSLRFLRWFCREASIEEVEGDLIEIFEKDFERSPSAARRKFTWGVIKHFRPAFIKSFKFGQTLNPTAMLRHNLTISFRNIKRYKGSFLLNVAGLSSGLACAILIYLWVSDELRVDRFHEHDSRLYQVMKNARQGDETIHTFEVTPAMMAQTMVEDLPEVEFAASVIKRDHGVASIRKEHLKAMPQFVNRDFFKVFSFNLIIGDKEKIFPDRNHVVLTEKMALKLFNTTKDIVGKTFEWEWWEMFNGTYTVAGIVETPPSNSTMQFDILFDHDLWRERNKDNYNWFSNNANTYVVLKQGTDPYAFGEKVKNYSRQKFEKLHGKDGLEYEGDVLIQRYSDHYLYDKFENGVQAGGRIQYVKLFSIVGVFILVIACINFMNLATAQASRRAKEVGVKKAIGARRTALIVQYIAESILITLISVVLAMMIVYLLLPQFRTITAKELSLHPDPNLILAIAIITFVTGIVSGSYPALYLSGFNPISTLKGLLNTSWSGSWIRKGLVVFQFFLSMLLIVSVVLVYKQIQFIQTKNLGFNKDNIVRITNEGKLRKDPAAFLNEVKRIPGVMYAAGMSGDLVGSHGGGGGIEWEGKDPNAGIEFSGLHAGHDLIEMLELKMAEGKTFSPVAITGVKKVIFNETAIRMMRLKDPVGKKVKMWGEEREIVGVVKDFHYESLYENVGPLFLRHEDINKSTMIKIKAGMEKETLEKIEKFYKQYNNEQPFEYEFIDQDFHTLYAAENRVAILSRYFAGIAILISCLGLFGLTAFTAERRAKEIGIRKILGLGEMGVVYLLSKDFTKIVLIAIILSIPVSFYIGQRWLSAFAYHIDLQWWYFIAPAAAALLIAWLTIGVQTIKAANVNPANTLKNE
jgi:putative ABC transport system permease protein